MNGQPDINPEAGIWEKVRDYLNRPEQEEILNQAAPREILRERAKELAREPERINTDIRTIEVIEFFLAHERYGIETSFIREVYPLKEITPIPFTPDFVAGVINVRGQIYSVIDIKKFFGLPDKPVNDINKVIIVANSNMEFGIMADVITGVTLVNSDSLQSSLPTLTGIHAEYLHGITVDQLIILNIENILSDKKILVYDEI